MNKKIKIFTTNLLVLLILIFPVLVSAQENVKLVKCFEGQKCGWNELITMINDIINFLLFKMAIPIAAIMCCFAGFKMVTAGGEAAHAREQAKSIFSNTVFGLILATASFIIIKTILSVLGYEGAWIGF